MNTVISTQALTKQFKGHTAVDGLNISIPEGVVYGFLGPNGSGKSTTMKMLLGLTQPTAGTMEIMGTPVSPATRGKLLPHIGSMIEAPPGYGHLTGLENMRIVQTMLDLEDRQISKALDIVRLTNQQHKLVKNYSLGMKQRLGIAMALAREPKVLILDEPTNGLDPAGIEEIRSLLISLAHEGISIMVSSHLLDEIDKTATVLGILNQGKLIFQGTRDQLVSQTVPDLIIVTPNPDAALATGINATKTADGLVMRGITLADTPKVIQFLVSNKIPLFEVRRAEQRLEDIFMGLTGRGGML